MNYMQILSLSMSRQRRAAVQSGKANNSESVGVFLLRFNIDGILKGLLCKSTFTLITTGTYTIIFW
jgi:hypothetical protein